MTTKFEYFGENMTILEKTGESFNEDHQSFLVQSTKFNRHTPLFYSSLKVNLE
jgi:hypothetical protein